MKMTPFNYGQFYWALPVPIVNEKNEVDRWEMVRVNARVVEADAGKGLVESDYLLLSVESDVFNVFRGSKQQKMRVRISRLDA